MLLCFFPYVGTGMLPALIGTRNRSCEPWAFFRGEGRHSAIHRYRQKTCFPVYLTAVWTRQTTTYCWLLGGGASCSHRAIVLLYWHTTLSRSIVTVFNNTRRASAKRDPLLFLVFQGKRADVQSEVNPGCWGAVCAGGFDWSLSTLSFLSATSQ